MPRDEFRILSFVNHIPVHPRVDEFLEEAARRGVDAVCSQGTGMDFGPYMLGSGTQFTSENFRENIRPYVRFAKQQGVPFVLSVGIAGGRTQLDEVPGAGGRDHSRRGHAASDRGDRRRTRS